MVSKPVRNGCWPRIKAARPRGATLLRVGVGEHRSLLSQAVDVRRLVAHHTVVVGADVMHADVITPDDEDVRVFCRPFACWPRLSGYEPEGLPDPKPCRRPRGWVRTKQPPEFWPPPLASLLKLNCPSAAAQPMTTPKHKGQGRPISTFQHGVPSEKKENKKSETLAASKAIAQTAGPKGPAVRQHANNFVANELPN